MSTAEAPSVPSRSQVRAFVDLARPFTLLPPLLGIVSGAVCAFGSVHNPDQGYRFTGTVLATIVLGSLCASFLNAASNVINQIYDLEIDRINKPKRPLCTGEVSIGAAWVYTWVLYALAIVPTWWVVVHPYDTFAAKGAAPLAEHQCFFIYLLGMAATFIYSAPALGRTKKHWLLANITIAIPRGCLLKVAGWSMVAKIGFTEPWFIGCIFMFFLIGAASTKDFSDMKGDAAAGCHTMPIVHGPKKAVAIMVPFFVLPWLLIPIGALVPDPAAPAHAILTGHPWALVALGVVLASWGAYTAFLLAKNPDELTTTENHPSWRHMYLMMMAAQIGFGLAYLRF